MTELAEIFAELGISQYLNDFIEQGFDTWETILDIKESDFDALNVKLGHRRKLQRKIASSRGLSPDRALESPGHTPADDRVGEEQKLGGGRADAKDSVASGVIQGAKRKYRRHPKADENAPERPPSAYVIFSNKMREDLKGRNLSFTEIAKLVGEHWQNLAPRDKEPFETQAAAAKEKYTSEMADYKKTEQYREYAQYLAEFKARQSNQQSVNDLDPSKRPKLEAHSSLASTGTTSSGTSQQGIDTPSSRADPSPSTAQWPSKDQHSSPKTSLLLNAGGGFGASKNLDSSVKTSPTLLPGYRDALYAGNNPSLPWRDGSRDDGAAVTPLFSRMASVGERRSSASGSAFGDPGNVLGGIQSSHPPPLLKSESTNSTVSSVFYTPRTPLEPTLERGMALPPIYSTKPPGIFENHLPPLRPLSQSPQTTTSGSILSPSAATSKTDFNPPLSLRGYGNHPPPPTSQSDARQHEYIPTTLADEPLDPVSALLRAGEIVNRNSQHNHP